MADKDPNKISALKALVANDANSIINSLDTNLSADKRRNSTVEAVSELLKGLLDKESRYLIQKSSAAMSQVTNNDGSDVTKEESYLPSYNVRTPVVKISINNNPVYPYTLNDQVSGDGTGNQIPSRLNFQGLNLTMPMGGIEKTVQGSITLFTKNPEDILQLLNVYDTEDQVTSSFDGFPTLQLQFGWAFSDSHYTQHTDQQVNTTAKSPVINFLITNVAMDDPGAAGTIFTLTLQELGTTVLQHSSGNIVLDSDYPQEQLRALLEGLLQIRLFTLDDLLYTAGTNSPQTNEPAGITNLLANKLDPRLGTLDKEGSPERQTFFMNEKGPDVSVNNKNYYTVATELASRCRCMWYPHKNKDKTATDDSVAKATSNINKLIQDLKEIKNSSDVITGELLTSIQKLVPDAVPVQHRSLGKEEALKLVDNEIKVSLARMASRCNLLWIPCVPATWNTTGSKGFATQRDAAGNLVTITPEEGAFFLLPDLLDDYDFLLSDLPICYGPGASKLPYFYGSGQNVAQSRRQTDTPQLFGEVLSLATSYNTLLPMLAQTADENLAYAEEGKRITKQQQIIFATNGGTPTTGYARRRTSPPITAESTAENTAKAVAKKVLAESQMRAIRSKFRFKHAIALGTGSLQVQDSPRVKEKDKSTRDSDIIMGGMPTPAATSVMLKIKSRVSQFLRYPIVAKIEILGDPNLIRLGPGCFEIFSYYPVEQPDGTTKQVLNILSSGLYFVSRIEHRIQGGDFITSIEGNKALDPKNVPSSVTAKILSRLNSTPGINKTDKNSTVPNNIVDQLLQVNLNNSDFESGFFAHELVKLYSRYDSLNPNK